MPIFLIRHAEAIDETLELGDPHRHLTPRGREQARALGERLRWHDCTATELWASPLVRAVQTAELVLGALGAELPVLAEPRLAPGGDVRALLAALRGAERSVALVGHEPILSGIGGALTGQAGFGALGKAEAVRIDRQDGGFRVRWRFAWSDAAPRPGE